MALKAGRVGLDPKYVTEEGAPISNSAEMESEIQQIKLDIADLQTSKVGITQLTANDKEFYFAYDATSQKYGYKLDGTGDFIPFEEAGMGWVRPANLITTGLSYGSGQSYVSGGYEVNGDQCYVDIVLLVSGTSTSANLSISGLPNGNLAYNYIVNANTGATEADVKDRYGYCANLSNRNVNNSGTLSASVPMTNTRRYLHVWCQYEIAT